MGKIGKFFSKVFEGVKKGATKVWNFGKKVVEKTGRVLRPAADIASKIGGFMKFLPGKAGKIGELLHGGASAIKKYTSLLPDSKAKTMIEQSIDKGVDTGQKLLNKGADVMNKVNDKAQPWIDSGVNISRKLADEFNRPPLLKGYQNNPFRFAVPK